MTNIGVKDLLVQYLFRFGLKWPMYNEAILGFFKLGWLWKFSCLAFKDFCSHKEFEKKTQLRRTTRTEITAGQSRQHEVCPSKNRQAAAARGSARPR